MYIMNAVVPGFTDNTSGHILRLSNQGLDGETGYMGLTSGVSPMSPLEASNVDRKIDDGLPASGSFRASLVTIDGGGCTNYPDAPPYVYLELNTSKDCSINYYLD